jgi:RND family efflux transporter MFP subunit
MTRHRSVRIAVIALVALVAGYGGMQLLGGKKQPPPTDADSEAVVHAVGMRVRPETVRIELTGFGTARAVRRAALSAEVGGRVTALNPAVENGGWVREGDWLVRIEAEDYTLRVKQFEAETAAIASQLEQLKQEQGSLASQAEAVRRNRDLAEREFERFRKLAMEDKVEPRSRMDSAERELLRQQELLLAMENRLELNPIQQLQQQARLASMQAQLADARLDLKRTELHAPFSGHIENKRVELGQFVQSSMEVLAVVDDATIELSVPLEGGEVARWLGIGSSDEIRHWFGALPDAEIRVRWTDLPERKAWPGRLARVERYDERTRTVVLVVRVDAPGDDSAGGGDAADFPLVEGMFCEVTIAGRALRDVYRLPQAALQEDGTVLTVENARMSSRPVRVARLQGNEILIDEGLSPGDVVLTRRPGQVLEGLRVEVQLGVGADGKAPNLAASDEKNTLETVEAVP